MRDEIERLARDAGEVALDFFGRRGRLGVEAKGPLDLVTAADREVERFLGDGLARLFPDDAIFGEEGAARPGRSGRTWVLDPIDGTFNFVRGTDCWVVSIGLHVDGKPAFGVLRAPVRGWTLSGGVDLPAMKDGVRLAAPPALAPDRAVAGVGFHTTIPIPTRLAVLETLMRDAGMTFRHNGSAAMSLAEVALGESDGYLGLGEASWDVMGALPILAALGLGTTLDWPRLGLGDKLDFACGAPAFLQAVAPVLPHIAGASGTSAGGH
jgi:myo-inositol-1(or 4)-monophosphatase